MLTQILDPILHMSPLAVYLIVFALVFSEAAIFVGFVFPGETAVILGGVIASQGRVKLEILIPLVIVGAIAGDSVGFEVGKRYGERVLDFKVLRNRRGGIDRAMQMLQARGAWAVFIGRFTAFLRAVIPGLAGLSGMRYRTFLMANAAGGILWGTGFVMLGYLVGNAYKRAEKYAGWASYAVLALVVIAAVVLFVRSKRKEKRLEESYGDAHPGSDGTGASHAGTGNADGGHGERGHGERGHGERGHQGGDHADGGRGRGGAEPTRAGSSPAGGDRTGEAPPPLVVAAEADADEHS